WTIPVGWSWDDAALFDADAYLLSSGSPGSYTICATAYGDGCAGNEVCIQTELVVGMHERGNVGQDFELYPNPARSTTRLIATEVITNTWSIQLLDVHGRVIRYFGGNGARELLIDRGALPSGIYLVRLLRDGHSMGSKRIVFD
ncbi:MAG TPA: T9SS type A sorting domain-containing protein, partial [Flavobacteriales bacterium]|nr:T9SS type A sorting domain-containing protein [Flavobacteriales bacterium]